MRPAVCISGMWLVVLVEVVCIIGATLIVWLPGMTIVSILVVCVECR